MSQVYAVFRDFDYEGWSPVFKGSEEECKKYLSDLPKEVLSDHAIYGPMS